MSDTTDRQLQALEATATTATILVTILTHLMVDLYVATEANPVSAWLIDSHGWLAFAGVRIAAVVLAFVVARSIANDGHTRLAIIGGSAVTIVTTANLLHDIGQTVRAGGLPETFLVNELAEFSATVLALTLCLAVLPRVATCIKDSDVSSSQLRVITFAAILIVSIVPAGAIADLGNTETDTQDASYSAEMNTAAGEDATVNQSRTLPDEDHMLAANRETGEYYAAGHLDRNVSGHHRNGSQKWHRTDIAGSDIEYVPFLNGVIVVGDYNDRAVAIDEDTGDTIGSYTGHDIYDVTYDEENARIWIGGSMGIVELDTSMNVVNNYSTGTGTVGAITFDDETGDLFVGDYDGGNVFRYDTDGTEIDSANIAPSTAQFHEGAGGTGDFWIVDDYDSVLYQVDMSNLSSYSTQSTESTRQIEYSSHTNHLYVGEQSTTSDEVYAYNDDFTLDWSIEGSAIDRAYGVAVDYSRDNVSILAGDSDNWEEYETTTSTEGIYTQTVSGQVRSCPAETVNCDNPDPVSNATVRLVGVDYDNIVPDESQTLRERANELADEAEDPIPNEFERNFDVESRRFDSASTEVVAVHTESEWAGSYSTLGSTVGVTDEVEDPELETPHTRLPEDEELHLSIWDPTESDDFTYRDNADGDLPGVTRSGTVVVEQLAPEGISTNRRTIETTEIVCFGSDTLGTEKCHETASINPTPGFYRIYPEGSPSAGYTIVVGNPDEISSHYTDELESRSGELTDRAQQIQQNFNESKFTNTVVTTNETGHYTAEVGSSVNTVAVTATRAGDINLSQVDNPIAYARDLMENGSYNGSLYVPSQPQRYQAPTSDADVVMREVTCAPHEVLQTCGNRSDEFLDYLRNNYPELWEALQQANATRDRLEDTYQNLHDIVEKHDETYTRAETLLQAVAGEDAELDINASEATDDELRSRIAALEQAQSEQRNTIEQPQSPEVTYPPPPDDGSTNDAITAIATFAGELTTDQVTVFAHFSNGTTVPVDETYISTSQSTGTAVPGQGSTEVRVEEFPLGDAASAEIEWVVSREGDIGGARTPVENPAIDSNAPDIDSIRFSSLEPGPNDRVTIEVNPADDSEFRQLTNADIYAPDGTLVTTDAIEDGTTTSFQTSGQGVYTAQLTFQNIDGENFTETVRLQAAGIDRNREPGIRATSGPTGVFAVVGDGLSDGAVTVSEGGDLSVAAGIGENGDVPSELHVYTGDVAANPSGDISVRVVQGPDDEAVSERSRVLIHGQATPEDGTYVYRDGRPVTTDGNQYGEVTHMSNQTLIETYTDESGEVTVSVAQPQGVVSSTVEWAEWNAKRIEVFGYSPLSILTGGASGLGLLGLGLFARRRRGDLQ